MKDEVYMRMALALAKKGEGWVNPNPMAGAVLVKNEQVIGQGYHMRYGGLHAERNAIADFYSRNSKEHKTQGERDLRGATLYVTLEPCCHYGKTPPCTEIIIEEGITRVVIGASDPNPLVCGKGVQILREHGIQVEEGVLRGECERQNKVFFHFMRTSRPYVIQKYAMTMDGKIATVTGKSRWITGEEARKKVHQTRHTCMGIMVGIGTVLADDPVLDCRIPGMKNPVRIICDSSLRTPFHAQVVKTAAQQSTILATCSSEKEKAEAYRKLGCKVLEIPEKEGHISLPALMERLGEEGIDSILLEGGADLNGSALQERIVNEVHTYIAPKIFGGLEARTPIAGVGVLTPGEAFRLTDVSICMEGEDICVESRVIYDSREEGGR